MDFQTGHTSAQLLLLNQLKINMETTSLEIRVNDFLNQKRIAVVGVSRHNSHHPVGNLIYRRLRNQGHEVFAVNPNMRTFEGENCYPNVRSIPGGVDGVMILDQNRQDDHQEPHLTKA